jgi:crotonobetainyl-CoA:carnitine CoA-transferase CaiB-like acyl-CoA transferase
MKRLGIDYPKLREINPKIIACSISGFGQEGPYRDRRRSISWCRRWAA